MGVGRDEVDVTENKRILLKREKEKETLGRKRIWNRIQTKGERLGNFGGQELTLSIRTHQMYTKVERLV